MANRDEVAPDHNMRGQDCLSSAALGSLGDCLCRCVNINHRLLPLFAPMTTYDAGLIDCHYK